MHSGHRPPRETAWRTSAAATNAAAADDGEWLVMDKHHLSPQKLEQGKFTAHGAGPIASQSGPPA